MSPMIEPAPQGGSIMVVDDNPNNLRLLDEMLARDGYEIRCFLRAGLALAAAHRQPPDLILLDINMPEMNGYQLCRELKLAKDLCAIPVVFLSALDSLESKLQG